MFKLRNITFFIFINGVMLTLTVPINLKNVGIGERL